MIKARLLLSAIAIALIAGGVVVTQSALPWGAKAAIGGAEAVLFAAALSVLFMTFVAIDEQGRIPRNSCYYKYIDFMINGVFEVKVPERLGLCPIFWLTVLGIVGAVVIVGSITAGFFFSLLSVVQHPSEAKLFAPIALGSVVGGVLLFVGLFVAISRIRDYTAKHFPGFVKWLEKFALSIFLIITVTLFVGMLVFAAMVLPGDALVRDHDKSVGEASLIVAGFWLFGLLGFAALIGATAGAILFFPWFKKSAIAKLIVGFYHKACPVFKLEQPPAPKRFRTKKADQAEVQSS